MRRDGRRKPPPALVAEVRALVETEGVTRSTEILGISKDPILRISAGFPLLPSTIARAESAIEKRAAQLGEELEATGREIAKVAR